MDEAKSERDYPAPLQAAFTKKIFDSHVDDRCGNGWFNKPALQTYDPKGGKRQGQRMSDGKTGDEQRSRADVPRYDEQTEEKKQMIVTGQDVSDPEKKEIGEACRGRGS